MATEQIAVISGLNIGYKNDDVHFFRETFNAVTDFLEAIPQTVKTFVLNGGIFAGPKLTPKSISSIYALAFEISQHDFDNIYINLSRSDHSGRYASEDNFFSAMAENGVDLFGDAHVLIATTACRATFGFLDDDNNSQQRDIVVKPAGSQPRLVVSECEIAFTCEDEPEANATLVINTSMSGSYGKSGNRFDISPPVQFNPSIDADTCAFHTINGDLEITAYPTNAAKNFINIDVEGGKINGEMAVKWLSQNRRSLQSALKIVVNADENTTDGALEKFCAVLKTVNSSFEVNDLSGETELPPIEASAKPLDAMLSVLPDEGDIHSKTTEIFEEATNENRV